MVEIERYPTDGKSESQPRCEIERYLESGVEIPARPRIRKNRTRPQSITTALFLFGIIFSLVFASEYVSEYRKLDDIHRAENQLELIPPKCRRFMIANADVYATETTSLWDYFKTKWIDEPLALECRTFILNLERERVRPKWPNPLQVGFQMIAEPVIYGVQTCTDAVGGVIGGFFQALFHDLDSLLDKILVIGVGVLVVMLYRLRSERRRFVEKDLYAIQSSLKVV